MQKKIIALAVAGLMSGAAFAQTNVTISGVLDVGVNNAKSEGKSASNNAAYNNTATSNITFRAQEDLGGGLKAGMMFETSIVPTSNTDVANFQRFVFVNGGFGELSFGQRTNFSTTTATTAQPFGTAMGGGYSGAFGRLRGLAYNATGALASSLNQNRDVRADGSIRYDSPNMQGFTAGLSWKPKNGPNAATETTPSAGHLNLGLNYANGPIKVSYAYAKIDSPIAAVTTTGATTYACGAGEVAIMGAAGIPVCHNTATNAIAGATATPGATTTAAAYEQSTKHNLLGANYTIGAFTLYGGYTTSKGNLSNAPDNVNSRSWNVAAKFAATGNIDLMANYLKDNDKTSADDDRKLIGLGMDYKFSKRTAAYLRYETLDSDTNAAGGKVTTYSAGLRHAF